MPCAAHTSPMRCCAPMTLLLTRLTPGSARGTGYQLHMKLATHTLMQYSGTRGHEQGYV